MTAALIVVLFGWIKLDLIELKRGQCPPCKKGLYNGNGNASAGTYAAYPVSE